MKLDDVILELYRLAETREWDGAVTDEALFSAIEGMEQIWEVHQADKMKSAIGHGEQKTAEAVVVGA